MIEIVESEEQKGKRVKKSEQSLKDLWDTASGPIYTLRESQREKREKGVKRIFGKKLMGDSFPDFMKGINTSNLEAQQPPGKMNSKRPTLRYIIIKLSKDKE